MKNKLHEFQVKSKTIKTTNTKTSHISTILYGVAVPTLLNRNKT
jgi:hypothetical protein